MRDLLGNYDPVHAYHAFQRNELSLDEIKACLPGQSSGGDARAIRLWAQRLTEVKDYHAFILDLSIAFQNLSRERFDQSLNNSELLLCLVSYLAYPPPTWAGEKFLNERAGYMEHKQRKLPGMGYALGSEFMRNLRWNGFKPDRHIQRLFNLWFPDQTEVADDVQHLQLLIGINNKNLSAYLRYSLIGVAASPSGVPLSEVDNFVWLLGAYVERKGKESATKYLG